MGASNPVTYLFLNAEKFVCPEIFVLSLDSQNPPILTTPRLQIVSCHILFGAEEFMVDTSRRTIC